MEKLKPIYEFLLWDNCKNNCQFCWQRDNPRLFDYYHRAYILEEVIKFINSDKFIKGSHILVCGGEIFDTPSDFSIMQEFFVEIAKLMHKGIIDLLYLNTNLIYKDTDTLLECLRVLDEYKLHNRIRFTASYDIYGRFKSEEDRLLMLNNLKLVRENYHGALVVNTILTKQACEAIFNKQFSVKQIIDTYWCWVNLIPYIPLRKEMTPTISDVCCALNQVELENPGYLNKYIPNIGIKQDKWLYMYKNNNWEFCSSKSDADCGHSVNFKKCFSDSDECFCCAIKDIFS